MNKRVLLILLTTTLFLTTLSAKTIKAGYLIKSGNFMTGTNTSQKRGGFAYEYLQTIAAYTDWDYEYQYGTWDELYAALLAGDIDLMPGVSYSEERAKLINFPDYSMGQLDSIEKKDSSAELYLAVAGNRTDILEELNNALNEIYSVNPYYNSSLILKYYSDTKIFRTLSPREIEWLKDNPTITVGCLKNDLPFTNLIENTSEAEGIIINLMNYLKINILPAKTNIDFQFYDNFEDLYQDFLDGKLHVIAPVYRDLNYAENNGTVLSEKFSSVIIAYVYRNQPDTKRAQIIAIPKNTRIPSYAEQNFPQAHIITYNSIEDCINAVINGDADGMIANIYKIRSILNKIRNYRMLKYIELPVYCDISFLTQKKDKPLISLINKMLMDIPAESITTYTEYYAVKEQGYTRKNFLDDYLSYLIVFSIIFVIMLISLVYALQRIKEYIEFDTLTRLLNRHNLEPIVRKVLRRAEEKHEPFSLFLLDLDDFKILNDTYGHAFGDKVLQSVAKAITTNITEQDYAFRWGGEEFLIIYKGDKEASIKAAERIRKTVEQQKLTDSKTNKTDISLTVTIGLAAYEDGQTYREMFQIADDNLYKGKRSGKNQVV